jgi:hypothetical protein
MNRALDGYEALSRLFEDELAAATAGDVIALERVQRDRESLIASLPAVPPAAAGPALRRAALLQRNVAIELQRRREHVLRELAANARAQRAAQGYAVPRRGSRFLDAQA